MRYALGRLWRESLDSDNGSIYFLRAPGAGPVGGRPLYRTGANLCESGRHAMIQNS